MKDNSFIQLMIKKGVEAKEKAIADLAELTTEQLNWKPSNYNWNITQCLEHLIISDGLRIGIIDKKFAQGFKSGIWEKINPLRSFWGLMLINQTQERVKNKIKAPQLFHPSTDSSTPDLIARYEKHLDKLLAIINKCSDTDIDQIHVTSPVSGLVTYSLRNAITIIIGHERRHINQALKIKKEALFPTYTPPGL